jgi:hypothetical protein
VCDAAAVHGVFCIATCANCAEYEKHAFHLICPALLCIRRRQPRFAIRRGAGGTHTKVLRWDSHWSCSKPGLAIRPGPSARWAGSGGVMDGQMYQPLARAGGSHFTYLRINHSLVVYDAVTARLSSDGAETTRVPGRRDRTTSALANAAFAIVPLRGRCCPRVAD